MNICSLDVAVEEAAAERPGVIGFNYWHMGMGGNEALILSDFSEKIDYSTVQSYFK